MPELPDLTVYVEALADRLTDQPLLGIRIGNPFVLRSVSPDPEALKGKQVTEVGLIGKRIVIELTEGFRIVTHLMVAGRLRWAAPFAKIPGRYGLMAFDFPSGTLILTEAGMKRRASVHLIQGKEALAAFDQGGIDVLACSREAFETALTRENHTIKRALTDPHILAGIGNAYSDEILHRARISPMRQTRYIDSLQWDALYQACLDVITVWTERLREETGAEFPNKVTAFHPKMAVHGKHKAPCPDCGKPVQRIRYADNEANYCAQCQNQGKLLADRSLSRLLKADWPKTLDQLES